MKGGRGTSKDKISKAIKLNKTGDRPIWLAGLSIPGDKTAG
ncbi:hypothetical protein BH18THE1_BH18THE1_22150 [soil metagenome]